MKKKIIIGVFCTLILVTAIAFAVATVDTYNYEIAHDDTLRGFGALLIAVVGGFVVLYELDLFYTVYYFFLKPKTIPKTLLNILSNLSLGLILCYMSNASGVNEIVPVVSFLLYILLRFVYGMIACGQAD